MLPPLLPLLLAVQLNFLLVLLLCGNASDAWVWQHRFLSTIVAISCRQVAGKKKEESRVLFTLKVTVKVEVGVKVRSARQGCVPQSVQANLLNFRLPRGLLDAVNMATMWQRFMDWLRR